MSNQSATQLGQKNLDDGFTTIHAPIKRHDGYNITIGDFSSSVFNVIYGFNKLLEHSVARDLKIKELEAKLAEAESNAEKYKHNYLGRQSAAARANEKISVAVEALLRETRESSSNNTKDRCASALRELGIDYTKKISEGN